jgi:hypothetical protein
VLARDATLVISSDSAGSVFSRVLPIQPAESTLDTNHLGVTSPKTRREAQEHASRS